MSVKIGFICGNHTKTTIKQMIDNGLEINTDEKKTLTDAMIENVATRTSKCNKCRYKGTLICEVQMPCVKW